MVNPVIRQALTPEEANLLNTKVSHFGARNILLDNANVESFEVPAGMDLNTLSIWRLPAGFYYHQWTMNTGIERIPGHFDEYTRMKLGMHMRNNPVNTQGPIYTEPEDDPIEDKTGNKRGGWRIKVLDLPPAITPLAIVDLLRLDIPALSTSPNTPVPPGAFRGEVSVRAPPSGQMRSAFVTANSKEWATAFLRPCFCGHSLIPFRERPITRRCISFTRVPGEWPRAHLFSFELEANS